MSQICAFTKDASGAADFDFPALLRMKLNTHSRLVSVLAVARLVVVIFASSVALTSPVSFLVGYAPPSLLRPAVPVS